MAKNQYLKRYINKFIYFLNCKFFAVYGLILFYRECQDTTIGVLKSIHFYLKK